MFISRITSEFLTTAIFTWFCVDSLMFDKASSIKRILYLSAPGAVRFGVPPELSNNPVSSAVVATSSVILNTKVSVIVGVYFANTIDCFSANTK
jgi:hypothetical protein